MSEDERLQGMRKIHSPQCQSLLPRGDAARTLQVKSQNNKKKVRVGELLKTVGEVVFASTFEGAFVSRTRMDTLEKFLGFWSALQLFGVRGE